MPNFEILLKQARKDCRIAIEVWTDILRELLGDRLKWAYVKGSAIKNWSSPVDYVPLLSDLDIHLMLTDRCELFSDNIHAFDRAIKISREYETLFSLKNSDYLHLPRTQIVIVNKLLEESTFVTPRLKDVQILLGEPEENLPVSKDKIRQIDYHKLLELEAVLETLPESLIDRSGWDYWIFLRKINWRVSPAPIRLLTQTYEDPQEIWSWNRTRISNELEKQGYTKIVKNYQGFYEKGWELFLSKMQKTEVFRGMIMCAYHVLNESLRAVRRIVNNR
ncbi:MAG: hypothetical protein ACFFCQ_09150 [Promethearchaeota archaeon]